jgi:transcriptional regulator with XRE-family HTH domain
VPADAMATKPSIFNLNLRRLRLERKLSQQELGDRLGVSRVYISQLENGAIQSPSTETAQKIADALGVSASALTSPEHGLSPIAPLLEEFRGSPYFSALKPTEAEMEWLARLERVFWLDVPPTFEAIVHLLKARRGEL